MKESAVKWFSQYERKFTEEAEMKGKKEEMIDQMQDKRMIK